MDKTSLAIFIALFSIFYLHIHFAGEEAVDFIRIVKSLYIPIGLILYFIEIYYLRGIFSFHHTGLFLVGFSFIAILFNKLKIWFVRNQKYNWIEDSILFSRLLGMFTFILPLSLASSIMNMFKLVLDIK